MKATDLYADGPAAGAKAKILLIHFDGAIDAGAAGRMAIGQLLRSLHNERVATFDADTLSLIHIWRCRRSFACRSRWSPYH